MTEPVRRIITGDTVGQVDATVVPRYGGEAPFARLPRLDEVTAARKPILRWNPSPRGAAEQKEQAAEHAKHPEPTPVVPTA